MSFKFNPKKEANFKIGCEIYWSFGTSVTDIWEICVYIAFLCNRLPKRIAFTWVCVCVCVCAHYEIICEYHRWPGVPLLTWLSFITIRGGCCTLASLPSSFSFSLSLSLCLSLSYTHTHTYTHIYTHKLWTSALYLATLGTEWHHTAPWSNSIVSGINRWLMFEDLAAVHKGDCLSLLIYHHNRPSIMSSSIHSDAQI